MAEFIVSSFETISDELHLLCRRYRAVALTLDGKSLSIASAQTVDEALLTALRFTCGRQVRVEYWPEARLNNHCIWGARRKIT